MKRFLFVITAMLLIVQGLWAQHVTPEQAKEKASQFLKANYARTGGKRSAPAVSELKTAVVFDAKDKKGLPEESGDGSLIRQRGPAHGGTPPVAAGTGI